MKLVDAVNKNHSSKTVVAASASVAEEVSCTVSARAKQWVGGKNQPILDYLRAAYERLSLDQIDSVFGFAERSTLYGGRPFMDPELSATDVWALYDHGIGFRLPISNSIVSRDEYIDAKSFLKQRDQHRI